MLKTMENNTLPKASLDRVPSSNPSYNTASKPKKDSTFNHHLSVDRSVVDELLFYVVSSDPLKTQHLKRSFLLKIV